jgi:hypothetical protein
MLRNNVCGYRDGKLHVLPLDLLLITTAFQRTQEPALSPFLNGVRGNGDEGEEKRRVSENRT